VSADWYAGAAEDYGRGRLPYPSALESSFESAVGRGGRLLDVGTVGLRLAGLFDAVVGVDREADMVEYARVRGESMGLASARFVQASAEELPADLGTFRVVVVAQAFHWFDGPRAAKAIRRVLEPGGHCVVLYAWSLRGDPAPNSGLPEPPYAAMDELSLDPWNHRSAAVDIGAVWAERGWAWRGCWSVQLFHGWFLWSCLRGGWLGQAVVGGPRARSKIPSQIASHC
jgi:SAM-dependent methyltransferase